MKQNLLIGMGMLISGAAMAQTATPVKAEQSATAATAVTVNKEAGEAGTKTDASAATNVAISSERAQKIKESINEDKSALQQAAAETSGAVKEKVADIAGNLKNELSVATEANSAINIEKVVKINAVVSKIAVVKPIVPTIATNVLGSAGIKL